MSEPIFFRVVTPALFIRPLPSRNTTPVGRLTQGQQIEVFPESRIEAEGSVWWQHALGWSAERALDVTGVPPLMERVILADQKKSITPINTNTTEQILLPTGTRIERPVLFQRHPVRVADAEWAQYYGNTRFAFNLQFDRSPKRQRMYFYAQGLHAGLDYGHNTQALPIVAGLSGRIEKVVRNATVYAPGYVNVRTGNFTVIYGHMGRIPPELSLGTVVTPDTQLGVIEPTQDHLHLEVIHRQTWIINPLVFMPQAMTDAYLTRFPFANAFHSSSTWTQWLTPFDQPVLRRGNPNTNPLIGPRSISG